MSRYERPSYLPRRDARVVYADGRTGGWTNGEGARVRALMLGYAGEMVDIQTRWVLPSWVPGVGEL